MILQARFGKVLPDQHLAKRSAGRCTYCCTRVELSTELAAFIAAWPSLTDDQRKGLALMCRV